MFSTVPAKDGRSLLNTSCLLLHSHPGPGPQHLPYAALACWACRACGELLHPTSCVGLSPSRWDPEHRDKTCPGFLVLGLHIASARLGTHLLTKPRTGDRTGTCREKEAVPLQRIPIDNAPAWPGSQSGSEPTRQSHLHKVRAVWGQVPAYQMEAEGEGLARLNTITLQSPLPCL